MGSLVGSRVAGKAIAERVGQKALIVEGGGMRCVFSTGVLDQFLAQDFSPFDSFWGVSAGASNLAAHLARMPKRNLSIYADYSCRKEFLSWGRFLRGGHLMDLDWLWQITMQELGLDFDTLARDPRPFFLSVTNQATGQAEYHTPSAERLLDTMKASSALPVVYKSGVLLGEQRYVDGGVADALPVAEAIRRGASKIMVLRSQQADYRKSPTKSAALTKWLLRRTPQLIEPMLARAERYNQTLALMRNPPPGVEIIEVSPPAEFELKRLTREPEPLLAGYQFGQQAAAGAIERWGG